MSSKYYALIATEEYSIRGIEMSDYEDIVTELYGEEKKAVLTAFRNSKLTHDEFIVKFILSLCNEGNKMKSTVRIMTEVLIGE